MALPEGRVGLCKALTEHRFVRVRGAPSRSAEPRGRQLSSSTPLFGARKPIFHPPRTALSASLEASTGALCVLAPRSATSPWPLPAGAAGRLEPLVGCRCHQPPALLPQIGDCGTTTPSHRTPRGAGHPEQQAGLQGSSAWGHRSSEQNGKAPNPNKGGRKSSFGVSALRCLTPWGCPGSLLLAPAAGGPVAAPGVPVCHAVRGLGPGSHAH